jgi:hypothetical protein
MNKSETIKELAQALTKAQAEMPAVQFNAKNPFLKNRYADLGAIIAVAKPVLAAHGLSVSQLMASEGDKVGVTTVLMHESGEWLESTATLPVGAEKGKSMAQVAGSIVTYLRRYGLASILGMYADEDGDGNEPSKQSQPAKKNGNGHKPAPKHAMDYETAAKVTNSAGELYISLDAEKLSNMTIGIGKALKKDDITAERRDELEFKLDAIKVILAKRAEVA